VNGSKLLYDLLSRLLGAENLQEVLPEVISAAARRIGADGAALLTGSMRQGGGRGVAEARPSVSSSAAGGAAGAGAFAAPHATLTYGLPEQALTGKTLFTELLVSLGLQEEQPALIADYGRYVFAHTALVELGVKAVAASPVFISDSPAGLLIFLRISDDRPFSKRDGQFAQILSMALAGRFENQRLRRLGREVRDEVETVQRTSSALTASLELPTVLDSILATAHDLVPADLAHIFLYDGARLSFGAASSANGRWDKPFAEPRPEGLTYRVATTGTPLMVEDIHAHPLYEDVPKKWRGSIAGLPLKVKQRVVGVMNISRFQQQPFNEEELRILEMLADQAAIAVENARLYETERTQRRRIEAMQSAVASLSQSLDLHEVLDRILTELRKVIPYDSASVMLLEQDHLRVVAGSDLPGDSAVGKMYPVMEIEREIERTGRPFILEDASSDDRYHAWGHTSYVKGWMSVPLLGREGMIGCLTLDSRKPGAYSDEDADLAMSFAHQAAIAVENAQLHQNVKDQLAALQASQAKLIQSEKLAAIGKLVAGVAHELNNPLTAIIGIAQLLQSRQIGTDVEQDLDRLVSEAHRAGKIVRSLLDFSRQQRPERSPVIVDDVLDSTLKILAYELQSRNIESRISLAGNLPPTMADANQLQQVFVNLVSNAYEAMQEAGSGGILRVTSELVQERWIRVSVEDDGPGIPANLQDRIFDPFLTTKSPGKGTGLGLSVCHGIISEHGGQIWVESTEGKGARFYVQIPVVPAESKSSEHKHTNQLPLTDSTTSRILVVEDDQAVRAMLVRVLQQAGFPVTTSVDGADALEKIEVQKYELIICDIRMPRLDGIELYKRLQQQSSEAAERMLFITGDTISEQTIGFFKENRIPFLGKPFEIGELLDTVQRQIKQ